MRTPGQRQRPQRVWAQEGADQTRPALRAVDEAPRATAVAMRVSPDSNILCTSTHSVSVGMSKHCRRLVKAVIRRAIGRATLGKLRTIVFLGRG